MTQVIFIEDDELVRRASVQSLQLAGFDVTAFGSVEGASRLIDASFPGVIVSDIRLPGASGLELLAQCRERAPEVPVILVTGHGDISNVYSIRDVYGSYAQAGASAGVGNSGTAQVLTKGTTSMALSGSGEGLNLGVAVDAFKIEPVR